MATKSQVPGEQESAGDAYIPASGERLTPLDLLIVLSQRRRLILAITLFFAIPAAVIAFLLPAQYTATVVLMPPEQNTSMASILESQLGGLGSMAAMAAGGLDLKNPNDMYVAMLKGQTVEDGMIRQYGLMGEYHQKYLSLARRAFESHTDVDGGGKDGLIHISVSDRSPQRAAELANGYVEQFRKLSEHLAMTEAGRRVVFFGQQLRQAKDNLASAEEALKETEQSTGLISVGGQAEALIASAAELRANIAAKLVEIQALSTFATGENAQLLEAKQELASLREQLAKLGGSEQSPDSLIVPKGKVPEAGLEYERRMRDVKYYETIFTILAQQYELAKLDQAREGSMIQVVDAAIVPDRKSSPHRILIILCAAVFGWFVGVLAAFAQVGWLRLNGDPATRTKLAILVRCWWKPRSSTQHEA